jgi:diguanylate cyclase (GGDEF)-like protein
MAVNINEHERINVLKRYHILDTPPDGTFDNITALVSKLLKVPIAIISLVDKDRIWFKSHHGIEISQIDKEPGLCASAILSHEAYILNDASIDPRALSNPLVAGEFGLRFYAAIPLQTHDGFNLGTLCCLDFKPRTLDTEQTEILSSLAQVVMDEIELRLAARRINEMHEELQALHESFRVQAAHDSLTGLWNRGAVMELLHQDISRSKREQRPLSVMVLDVDYFKTVNDNYGHLAGDQVLIEIAKRLKQSLRDCNIGRIGGEEFLCVMYPCNTEQSLIVAERCRQTICEANIEIGINNGTSLNLTISIGLFSAVVDCDLDAEHLIRQADEALYRSKRNGRNCITVC